MEYLNGYFILFIYFFLFFYFFTILFYFILFFLFLKLKKFRYTREVKQGISEAKVDRRCISVRLPEISRLSRKKTIQLKTGR